MSPPREFYVTDTHPFLWHLSGDHSRLGTEARAALDRAESGEALIVIPAVVMAEALYIAEKKRVKAKLEQILSREWDMSRSMRPTPCGECNRFVGYG